MCNVCTNVDTPKRVMDQARNPEARHNLYVIDQNEILCSQIAVFLIAMTAWRWEESQWHQGGPV